MPSPMDYATTYAYTGGGVPAIIGDVAGAASSIYAAVSGKPVQAVAGQVQSQLPGNIGGFSAGTLLVLVLVVGGVWLLARRK